MGRVKEGTRTVWWKPGTWNWRAFQAAIGWFMREERLLIVPTIWLAVAVMEPARLLKEEESQLLKLV